MLRYTITIPFCYGVVNSEKETSEKERMNFMTEASKMEEKMKETRREYYRQWRAKNKDKVRQHNRNYWLKKAQQNTQQKGETNHA